ncbi:hypothetical protein [Sphaerotilus mobilis]|uniref:hypothetical protein n=1 Tax=Sphaerotilus mobilis TaxID=47994 RepID=UPI00102C1515|nr:hypothetical protein [Sphaerotilus mobilis]
MPIEPFLSVAGRYVEGELQASALLLAAARGQLRRGDLLSAVRGTGSQSLAGFCARLQAFIELKAADGSASTSALASDCIRIEGGAA